VHEMSIVQSLIEQVGVEVEGSPYRGRVLGLDLVVGRMSGVHVDSLRFAFEVLSPGTLVAGAELRIHQPRATISCRDCGARCEIDQILLACPACGSGAVMIQGGQELLLQSIELADESEADGSATGPHGARR
jgi:hydrogenase nickel incorporation protein HypA/HybF